MSKKIPIKKGGKNAQERALAKLYGAEGVNAAGALVQKLTPPGFLGGVDTTVPYGQESMQRYGDLAKQYGTRDPVQEDVMNRMKNGLEGYTSQEYQAQREAMSRGLNSNLQTGLSQLARAQARGKVYGAAASAQSANAIRGNEDSKNQLEQDLMIKNIDEKQRRLGEYGKYAGNLTQAEYDRQTGINNDMTTQGNNLGQAQLEREKLNIGNKQAEIGTQIGLYTGTLGQGAAKAGNRAARRLSKYAIDKVGAM